MKYNQDELYLLVDFLEESLETVRQYDGAICSEAHREQLEIEETMFEMSIEVIKSLIKE